MNPVFYHSPPERAVRGREVVLLAAAEPSVLTVSAVCNNEKILLSPLGEREGLQFWQGSVLPPPDAGQLQYTLYADLAPMGSYCVPLSPLDLAPLAMTEICLRAPSQVPYIEIMNTTSDPIDLAEYRLVWKMGTRDAENPLCDLPITDEPGAQIIPPRSVAVLWIAFASTHNDPACLTAADFCARCEQAYAWRNLKLSPDAIQIVRIEAAEQKTDGAWRNKPGINDFPKMRPWETMTLAILPRDGSLDDAVVCVTVNPFNPDDWNWDTCVRRASLWQPDPFGGAAMKRVAHAAYITPGLLDCGQCVPDPDAPPTLIVPMNHPAEYALADGDLTLRFLMAGGTPRCAELQIAGEIDALPLAAGEADIWSVTLPASLLCRLETADFTVVADGGVLTSRLVLPRIKLIDNAGPIVTKWMPEDGYAALKGTAVEFSAAYTDRAGVDAHASHLYLDGMEIGGRATWTADGVRCTLDGIKPGRHKIALKLYDCLGNSSRTVSYFTIAGDDAMRGWRGEVHSHTADSDGVALSEDAMAYARDVGGVDYFAVTDHGHYMPKPRYAAQKVVADRFNEPGRFAALWGWEMTWNRETGWWGHINILDTDYLHNDIRDMGMPELFADLADDPSAIGMFNHPDYDWGNFDDFGHKTPAADALMCLTEIKGRRYDAQHALALSRGWHVAPVSNEDNHTYTWTTAKARTGFVLAPALTRQNVLEAFRVRRTYSTSDNTLQLRFRINGAWLGSRIPATDLLTVDISLDTERPEGLGEIRLVAEDNITVALWDAGAAQHFSQRLHIPADFDYYYLRITNPTVPDDYTISAPVWVEGRDALVISDLSLALTGGEMPNLVTLTLENRGQETITDLRADFYLTQADGFTLDTARPHCTVYPDKLRAGETLRTERPFPNLGGRRRLSVIVSGKIGKHRFADTRYILLTPVSIVEVLPDSSPITAADGVEVKNPFAYAVLYNQSNAPLCLDGAQLRMWTKLGREPKPEASIPLDGVTVAPRSTAVIWTCPLGGTLLTADDFNARYGTALVEGESLFPIDFAVLKPSHAQGQRLDIKLQGDVVSRVHWNYGTEQGKEPTTDRAIRYAYPAAMTATAVCIDSAAEAVPGTVAAGQIPPSRTFIAPERELKRAQKAEKKAQKVARRPQKPGIAPSAAAALGIGGAVAGIAAGAGGALLAMLCHDKRKRGK
ncbi:MAG: CehA/McbA family metallohydrolase [Clostridia bacterium]|nr:CehA/McbA family metallohydrolase [Clostridia bacterium]